MFFFPETALLFSEPPLIAELAQGAVLSVCEEAGLGFGENLGWGVIDEGGAREGRFYALLDEFHNLDGALVRAIE